MNLYIIRHGETDWNKQKRMQGQVDIPLNDYGRELAHKTKEGLKDIHFDYVFSSPLIRAVETAQIILEGTGSVIVTDDRIKEISFGEYEGKYPDERPKDFIKFFEAPEEYVPGEGAESYEQLCARTADFIENVILPISVKDKDANVLISGHGAMNKSILLYFNKAEIKDIWAGPFQQNCCVTLYEICDETTWELKYENKIFYEKL